MVELVYTLVLRSSASASGFESHFGHQRLAVRKTVTICSCGGIGRRDTLKMCFSMGSSPIGSTTSCSTITAIHGLLAQSVEQRTVNPRVAGSSPVQPAICPSGGMAYALV